MGNLAGVWGFVGEFEPVRGLAGWDAVGGFMGLTTLNQQLRRDLKEAAALLKWPGVDIMQVATRLSEAGLEDDVRSLMKIAPPSRKRRTSLRGMRKG